MGDLDDDGDLDLVWGLQKSILLYYRNEGSKKVPDFVLQNGTSAVPTNLLHPLNAAFDNVGFPTPVLHDLSQDGLLDLIVGIGISDGQGKIAYAKNTGTATNPAFILISGAASPFNQANGDNIFTSGKRNQYPTVAGFFDWSRFSGEPSQGRTDLVVGGAHGYLDFFRNEAADGSDPQFVARPASPMFGDNRLSGAIRSVRGTAASNSRYSSPQFVDMDKDGKTCLVKLGSCKNQRKTELQKKRMCSFRSCFLFPTNSPLFFLFKLFGFSGMRPQQTHYSPRRRFVSVPASFSSSPKRFD